MSWPSISKHHHALPSQRTQSTASPPSHVTTSSQRLTAYFPYYLPRAILDPAPRLLTSALGGVCLHMPGLRVWAQSGGQRSTRSVKGQAILAVTRGAQALSIQYVSLQIDRRKPLPRGTNENETKKRHVEHQSWRRGQCTRTSTGIAVSNQFASLSIAARAVIWHALRVPSLGAANAFDSDLSIHKH